MAISVQPVISRETRRLLITVVAAVATLWVLARIRFQERPVTSTPVPNVLAQLRPSSSYADLARLIADIRPTIVAAVSRSAGGGPALRIREDAAVTLRPGRADTPAGYGPGNRSRDCSASEGRYARPHAVGAAPVGLSALSRGRGRDRRARGAAACLHRRAVPRDESTLVRGVVAASACDGDFAPARSCSRPKAHLPASASATTDRRRSFPPASCSVLSSSCSSSTAPTPGDLGIAIQPLSPSDRVGDRRATGVVVTAIDPAGAAAGTLVPTDVIEAIDGEDIRTTDHWRARVARVDRRRHADPARAERRRSARCADHRYRAGACPSRPRTIRRSGLQIADDPEGRSRSAVGAAAVARRARSDSEGRSHYRRRRPAVADARAAHARVHVAPRRRVPARRRSLAAANIT